MFGMGMGELILIAVVALLFLGPDKLPEAAKSLSKGIRDLRKQTRELQETLEGDHEIGSAIKDLKSALRGDELPSIRERQRLAAEKAREARALEPPASSSSAPPLVPPGQPESEAAPDGDRDGDLEQAHRDFQAAILGEWAAPEHAPPPDEPVNPHLDEPDKLGSRFAGMPLIRPVSHAVPTNALLDRLDDAPGSPGGAAVATAASSRGSEPAADSDAAVSTSANQTSDRNHG